MNRVGLVLAPADGGIAAHARSLLHRLPDLGWPVRVCAPAAVLGTLLGASRTAPDGVELVAVRFPPGPLAAAVDPRLAADLRAALHGVDVVSAQGLRAAGAGGGTRTTGTPLVVTLHNAPPSGGAVGLLGRLAFGRAVREATLVLAASADLRDAAGAAGARAVELLEVAAPAGRPADPLRAAALRRDLDPDGRGLVVTAGRLAPQKDHALALAALALLPADRRPVLAIAGEGPLRDALLATIAAGQLPVRLLGERRDVPELLGAADAALLCSRWEARSLFAQESLRAGVPLVATAVGGLPGLLGDAAVVVRAGDAAALATGLVRVLHDEQLRSRLPPAGRARAATWPTEDDTSAAVAASLGRFARVPGGSC